MLRDLLFHLHGSLRITFEQDRCAPHVQGVVLDFDGVLGQTMEQHAEAYRQILAPYGVSLEDRDVFVREGARSESIIRDLLEAHGQGATGDLVARLADEKQGVFASLGVPALYEGAQALVDALADATPHTALVTGTRRENLERIAPAMLPRFEAVLAQDSYTHDKPHPEPYLKAAAALGLDPAQCIALENAIRGVQSALAAGYGCVVAITTTLTREDLEGAGAHWVVGDHAEAAKVILAQLDGGA